MNTNIIIQALCEIGPIYNIPAFEALAERIEILESDRARWEEENHNEIMREIDPHGQGL